MNNLRADYSAFVAQLAAVPNIMEALGKGDNARDRRGKRYPLEVDMFRTTSFALKSEPPCKIRVATPQSTVDAGVSVPATFNSHVKRTPPTSHYPSDEKEASLNKEMQKHRVIIDTLWEGAAALHEAAYPIMVGGSHDGHKKLVLDRQACDADISFEYIDKLLEAVVDALENHNEDKGNVQQC